MNFKLKIKLFLHRIGSFRKLAYSKIKRFLFIITFKRIRKLTPIRLVDSLRDITQFNWEQLDIHHEYKWLFKDERDIEDNRRSDSQLIEDKYCQLHDEAAVLSGSFFTLEKIMILMAQRIEARVKLALGDRKQKNDIRMLTAMIDQLLKGGDTVDMVKQRMMIQKAYGQPLDPKKISAFEFLQVRNLLQEQVASAKK